MNLCPLLHSRSLLKKADFFFELFNFIFSSKISRCFIHCFCSCSKFFCILDNQLIFRFAHLLLLNKWSGSSTNSIFYFLSMGSSKIFPGKWVLCLIESIFIRCILYLFLNLEEGLSLHITSESMLSVGEMCWSYKWNKKTPIVSLFFCFESERIKDVLQVPSQTVAAVKRKKLLQLHNADCTSFWYSQEYFIAKSILRIRMVSLCLSFSNSADWIHFLFTWLINASQSMITLWRNSPTKVSCSWRSNFLYVSPFCDSRNLNLMSLLLRKTMHCLRTDVFSSNGKFILKFLLFLHRFCPQCTNIHS